MSVEFVSSLDQAMFVVGTTDRDKFARLTAAVKASFAFQPFGCIWMDGHFISLIFAIDKFSHGLPVAVLNNICSQLGYQFGH